MKGRDVVLLWDILAAVLGEHSSSGESLTSPGSTPPPPTPMEEGMYATDAHTFETQSRFVRGARSMLEETFREHIDFSIRQRRLDAQLGGQPGVLAKVMAYIRTLPMPQLHMMEERSEKWDEEWVWAILYYLLRAGGLNEAVSYVQSRQAAFSQAHPAFPSLFQSYVRAKGQLVPEDRSRIQEYFHRHLRHTWERGDVYRFLVYKILGRCDLRKRTFSEVINTTDDYLWLQLMLVSEGNTAPNNTPSPSVISPHHSASSERESKDDLSQFMLFSDSLKRSKMGSPSPGPGTPLNSSMSGVAGSTGSSVWGEEYTLDDLQSSLRALGPKHYAPSSRPLLFPQLLLYTGQFGEAVQYLQGLPGHEIDAMHILIVCAYYGVLGMVFTPLGSSVRSKSVVDEAGSIGKFAKTLPIINSPAGSIKGRPSGLFQSTSSPLAGLGRTTKGLDQPKEDEEEEDNQIKIRAYESTRTYVEAVAAYVRQYESAETVDAAMQYLYLFLIGKPYGTTGDVNGEAIAHLATSPEWKALLELCHSQLRHLLIRSRQYSTILGRMDAHGNVQDGELTPAKFLLLGLQTREELADRITRKVAQWCQEHGRVVEAVRLHSLTQDYDLAVRFMVQVMGEVLMTPRYDRNFQDTPVTPDAQSSESWKDESSPMGKAEEIMTMAAEVSSVYGANGEIRRKVTPEAWRSLEILLSLEVFLSKWRAQQWESALDTMLAIGLFPIRNEVGLQGGDIPAGWWMHDGFAKSRPGISREGELEEAVGRNIPALLVVTMEILCKLYKQVKTSRFGKDIRIKVRTFSSSPLNLSSSLVNHSGNVSPFSLPPLFPCLL